MLDDQGLPTPAVHSDADALCMDRLWLRKPRDSSGGHGVAFFNPRTCNKDAPRNSYYQQYITGPSLSGVFIAAHDGVKLLGVSRQLVGTPWLGADSFSYAGSIGPMSLDAASKDNWLRIGEVLSQAFGLRGLFGVDAISSENAIYPVELNPRFTASVEIFERAFSRKTIRDHVLACCGGQLERQTNCCTKYCYGKAILFAVEDIVIPAAMLNLARELNADESWPVLADIPHEGTTIRSGPAHPDTDDFRPRRVHGHRSSAATGQDGAGSAQGKRERGTSGTTSLWKLASVALSIVRQPPPAR